MKNTLKIKRYLPILLLIFPLLQECKQTEKGGEEDLINTSLNTISVSGTRFTDTYGRQVILSGINRVNKNPEMNYIDSDSINTFKQFSKWGFNCIRLGIIWDGVEPEPGKYDETYLDKIEERINWAAQNGLYVLLDMHQDLYSVLYSDGAPEWATITNSQPHAKGDIWSDSYLISPAVQTAFDNFWANAPAPDGIGIQDHYAKMWQHVAGRFSKYNAVIGYDIMNEPFNGSSGAMIVPQILTEYAKLHAEETGKVLSQEELLQMWSDEESRFKALQELQDPEKYSRVIETGTKLNQEFEKTVLQPMYQRVANLIREIDTTHILFIEHSYFGNTGIASGIEPLKKINGEIDKLVAYAAHGYDLLVDTKNYDSQSNSRVDLIFSGINETSQRTNLPVLVGEWGAFSGPSEGMATSAGFIIGLFEKFGFGNTYWAYSNGIEKNPYFRVLVRPYPQYLGGNLIEYGYNHESGAFKCSWAETPGVKAPTVIYIPDLENLRRESITINPERSSTVIQAVENSKAGYLIIPVTGNSVKRTIEFRINKNMSSFSIEDKTAK